MRNTIGRLRIIVNRSECFIYIWIILLICDNFFNIISRCLLLTTRHLSEPKFHQILLIKDQEIIQRTTIQGYSSSQHSNSLRLKLNALLLSIQTSSTKIIPKHYLKIHPVTKIQIKLFHIWIEPKKKDRWV